VIKRAVVVTGLCVGVAGGVAAQTLAEKLAALDAEQAAIGDQGPNFPASIDLHRLRAAAYAEAFESDCAEHQSRAAAEAALYEQNPYVVLLPHHEVQRWRLEATLAFGRGQCAGNDEDLTRETEDARDKALQGLEVAVRQHDYDSEALLRFDVAHYSHLIQDEEDTVGYLESAIAVDDAHGLQADGDDNRQILANWAKAAADTLPAAPAHSPVTFRFQWHPATIDDDSTVVLTSYSSGAPVAKTFDQSHQELIEKRSDGGFRQSVKDVSIQSRSAFSDDDADAHLAHFVQEVGASIPPIDIAADGAFIGFSNYDGFIAHIREAADAFVRSEVAADSPRRADLEKNLPKYLAAKFSKASMENEEAENHALTTSIWIGSTLKVGQSMSMTLSLPLQGVPNAVIKHQFAFRLDGTVACNEQDTATPHCVELEMEAQPQPAELTKIAATLAQQGKGTLHYWSSLTQHLIVNPETMEGYGSESHRSYYLQLGDLPVEAQRLDSRHRARYRD
jgi:hypothetical protein